MAQLSDLPRAGHSMERARPAWANVVGWNRGYKVIACIHTPPLYPILSGDNLAPLCLEKTYTCPWVHSLEAPLATCRTPPTFTHTWCYKTCLKWFWGFVKKKNRKPAWIWCLFFSTLQVSSFHFTIIIKTTKDGNTQIGPRFWAEFKAVLNTRWGTGSKGSCRRPTVDLPEVTHLPPVQRGPFASQDKLKHRMTLAIPHSPPMPKGHGTELQWELNATLSYARRIPKEAVNLLALH